MALKAAVKKTVEENVDEWVTVVFKDPKKTGTLTLRDYHERNRDGSANRKVIRLKDEDGEPLVWPLSPTGRRRYNMRNKTDKNIINHLKGHPIYMKFVDIIDPNKRSEEYLSSIDDKIAGMNIARDMSDAEVKRFARVLTIPVIGQSTRNIRANVCQYAEQYSKEFLALYNDPNRELSELLLAAKDYSVVTAKSGRWMYSDVVMGTNLNTCITYLTENSDMVASIRIALEQVAPELKRTKTEKTA